MIDPKNIGQGRTHEDATDAYDAEHGEYEHVVGKLPKDERLQELEMPKAPDPSPFALGPMAPGGR
jgi:hypothetical protein